MTNPMTRLPVPAQDDKLLSFLPQPCIQHAAADPTVAVSVGEGRGTGGIEMGNANAQSAPL